MLAFSSNSRIFVYEEAVDMRKGFEGLSVLIKAHFQRDLSDGAYFAFLNNKRNRIKVLYWDGDGLALWYKRLEKGHFSYNKNMPEISRKELFMLLEGITPKKVDNRFKFS